MRKFRGSMEFACWRLVAWDADLIGAGAFAPAGHPIQYLFKAATRVDDSDPQFAAHIVDGTQVLGRLEPVRGGGNQKLAASPNLSE